MTREEFSYITRGSLYEAVVIAFLAAKKDIAFDDVRIVDVRGIEVLAEGWDQCTEYIVERMYFGEDKIKPCADLVVHSRNEEVVDLMVYIAGFPPKAYGLNRSGGVGPFIKAYNEKWLQQETT